MYVLDVALAVPNPTEVSNFVLEEILFIILVTVLPPSSTNSILSPILKSVKKAMPEYGTLLIAEPMAGGNSTKKMSDAYFGMYLMAMGKGSARTHKEIFAFLKQVGFKNIRSLNVSLPIQTGLIVAKS